MNSHHRQMYISGIGGHRGGGVLQESVVYLIHDLIDELLVLVYCYYSDVYGDCCCPRCRTVASNYSSILSPCLSSVTPVCSSSPGLPSSASSVPPSCPSSSLSPSSPPPSSLSISCLPSCSSYPPVGSHSPHRSLTHSDHALPEDVSSHAVVKDGTRHATTVGIGRVSRHAVVSSGYVGSRDYAWPIF